MCDMILDGVAGDFHVINWPSILALPTCQNTTKSKRKEEEQEEERKHHMAINFRVGWKYVSVIAGSYSQMESRERERVCFAVHVYIISDI